MGYSGAIRQLGGLVHTVDGRNPTPPKKFWNGFPHINKQRFHSHGFKAVRVGPHIYMYIHAQAPTFWVLLQCLKVSPPTPFSKKGGVWEGFAFVLVFVMVIITTDVG